MNASFARPPDGEEVDLYALLGVEKTATVNQIKKAYKKRALQVHPDKVSEDEREEAEAKFKAIKQAHEILINDEYRAMYDAQGMTAFDPTRGGNSDVDMNDLISQLFGMRSNGDDGPRRPRQGADELREYKVTLEELYKGKTVKFAANKQIVCNTCKGSGAKHNASPSICERCHGHGIIEALRSIRPGLMQQETMPCDNCSGSGKVYKAHDKCKKCKGKRVLSEDKLLEIYIPRGAMQGEQIVLDGEADQLPDQIAGNIVFKVMEEPHDVFERIGPDLSAPLKITLSEALCGFSRVVITHLDGRGISINRNRGHVLRPGQVLKVAGEGMPLKRGEDKGDLYLVTEIQFPEDDWLGKNETNASAYEALLKLLPSSPPAAVPEIVDEVQYEDDADVQTMGENSGDPRFKGEWEDEEVVDEGGPQCATQ